MILAPLLRLPQGPISCTTIARHLAFSVLRRLRCQYYESPADGPRSATVHRVPTPPEIIGLLLAPYRSMNLFFRARTFDRARKTARVDCSGSFERHQATELRSFRKLYQCFSNVLRSRGQ